MDFTSIIWFLIMLSALQPVVSKKMREAARTKLIRQLESKRGSRVILLCHRQETMSLLGFPMIRYITVNDSEEVLRALDMTDKDVPVDLIMHTPGGLVLAATQIASAIKRHPGKVTAFVPHYAMSGGTLIALAADEIVMSPNAVLGPVDPQLGSRPAASLLRVVRDKPVAEVEDETLILADQAEKAVKQVRETVRELIEDLYPPDEADELATMLSEGRWTHDRPITFREMEELGHPVSNHLPVEIVQLMALYPQPTKKTRSVQYLRERYPREDQETP